VHTKGKGHAVAKRAGSDPEVSAGSRKIPVEELARDPRLLFFSQFEYCVFYILDGFDAALSLRLSVIHNYWQRSFVRPE